MPVSNIPSEMIEAYRATDYRVFDQSPFVLNIGRSSQPLKQLYNKHGCASAAFITAWNPYSQAVSGAENARYQASLERELSDVSTILIAGIGEDPTRKWPGEMSVLALGISLEAAKSAAIRFKQNAFVWVAEDANPELAILR